MKVVKMRIRSVKSSYYDSFESIEKQDFIGFNRTIVHITRYNRICQTKQLLKVNTSRLKSFL